MKKLFLLVMVMPFILSCDFILKDTSDAKEEVEIDKTVVLGTDKDENGCVASAGYKWSGLRNECIRVFEEGYRLNPIDALKEDGISKSAFVIFEEGGDNAELYLPNAGKAIMLKRENDKSSYKDKVWTLQLNTGYTLSKNGQPLYAGAAIEEQKITGDTEQE